MNEDEILEPQKYFSAIKSEHSSNVDSFFNDLVTKSGIDIEANRQTNKEIKEKEKEISASNKKLNSKNGLRGFLIAVATILFVVAVLIFIYYLAMKSSLQANIIFLFFLIPILCIASGIGLIVLIKKKINTAIKKLNEILEKLNKEKNDLINKAKKQMAPLNALYDWNIAADLFSKTIPIVQLDKVFDNNKYQMLHDKYGFDQNKSNNISTLMVQSGSILGNPFLVRKNFVQEMSTQRYVGHLTITWTTYIRDSKGHRIAVPHTQILEASVVKPKPIYFSNTELIYGNEVADKLTFSRRPPNIDAKNDKEMDKFLKKFDKKLDKMTQDSIKEGGNFQRMSNVEFEALFNALNRDNNLEFRLLFTPLAQKNLISLLKCKEPFGDDFSFNKRKCLNYIVSQHSQTFDYSGDPEKYYSYNFDEAEKFFKEYNLKYFDSLYYDLAPLASIPLYQQHKAFEYIYEGTFNSNVTNSEAEVMANSYDDKIFKNEQSATPAILKIETVAKENKADNDIVHAYSFKTERRLEYVDKLGGDGFIHAVPVYWDEYIPVKKETYFTIQESKATKQEFDENVVSGKIESVLSQYTNKNAIIFQRGLISFLGDKKSQYKGEELNKLFTNKEE